MYMYDDCNNYAWRMIYLWLFLFLPLGGFLGTFFGSVLAFAVVFFLETLFPYDAPCQTGHQWVSMENLYGTRKLDRGRCGEEEK